MVYGSLEDKNNVKAMQMMEAWLRKFESPSKSVLRLSVWCFELRLLSKTFAFTVKLDASQLGWRISWDYEFSIIEVNKIFCGVHPQGQRT